MKSVFTKIKARRAAMLLLVGVMTLTVQMAWAQTTSFPTTSGGAGTENDPYLIMTPADLNTLASDVNSGTNYSNTYFKLGTNIAYSHKADNEEGANTENNYTAIGTSSNPFSGTFDGMGYTVSGIRIYKGGTTETDSYQGLFGMASGATIKNVMLADARITGYQNVGGIAGYLENGVIDGCCNTGYIKAVMDCAGGIAGRMSSTTNAACYVQKSFNSGYVKGRNQVGGIVGRMSNQNYFSNCYNTGVVKGIAQVGGLVGLQEDPTVASDNSYSAGWVEASSMAGAVCGFSTDPTKIVNCHYDNLMCSYKGVNEQDVTGVTGHLTSGMVGTGLGFSDGWVTDDAMYPRLSAFATSTAGIASALTVDFGTDFQGEYKKAYDLPSVGGADYILPSNEELSWEKFEGTTVDMLIKDGNQDIIHTSGARTMEVICAKKDGTAYRYLKFSFGISERNPIVIENIDGKKITDLCNLINTSESEFTFNGVQIPAGGDGYYFSLQNGNYSFTEMWTPIGTSEHPFKGYIDGKNDIGENSTITILYDGASSDYVGLFGYMQGRVKNVTVTGNDPSHIFIKGRDYVGAIAGYCHGTIESCAVLAACDGFGKIEGRNYVGGLVGQAFYSQILNCSNGCNVQGDNHVGGIVGDCSASVISGCVNTATICGTCGVDDPATGDVDESQNVTWLYNVSTNTLTISGTGAMADYASADDQPWKDYRSSIASVAIGDGVTSIGSYAFSGCTSLTSVALNGAATIGSDAFPSTATVTIADGLYLHNGSEVLSGNVTDMSKLNGKTLVSVTVIVPELTVSDGDITATTAIATWTACDNVSSYTIQLASDDQFSTGGAGNSVTLFSNDGTDATSAPTGWTYNVSDKASAYLLMFSGHSVVSEAVNAFACTDLSVSLDIRTYGGTSQPNLTIQYSTDNGSSWTDAGTVAAANSTMAERTLDLPAAAASSELRLRFAPNTTSSSIGVGIKSIVLTGSQSAGDGSLIAEYSVTDGTSYTFTGLTPETTYYARVKGDDDWSDVEVFTTDDAGNTAPTWSASFPTTATIAAGEDYELQDVSTYTSGIPFPAVTLTSASSNANSNDYSFEYDIFRFNTTTPGTYTFTFTAANGISPDATATLTVTVNDWTELKEIDDPLAVLTAQSGNMVPVKFTRSGLTAGAYSTVCLPFAFEAPEGCAFYTFVGVAQDASGEWFADVTAAEPPYLANTPYIFKSATATSVDFTNESVVAAASYSDANAKTVVSSDWTIQGTYSRIDLPKEGEHAYGFTSTAGKSVQNNDLEAGTFVYLVTGAWAAPFRAYLKYTGSDAAWQKGRTRSGAAALPSSITVRIVGSKGTATEIGTLRLETEDGEWYSLDGRRLVGKPATKGIYIKDGKKVIVK